MGFGLGLGFGLGYGSGFGFGLAARTAADAELIRGLEEPLHLLAARALPVDRTQRLEDVVAQRAAVATVVSDT